MLRNYLTIAWRNLLRYRTFSLVSIVGMALGLAGSLLISFYVGREMAYDRHHPDHGQIYRLVADRHYTNGEHKQYATSPLPLARLVQNEITGIRRTTRVFSPQWTTRKTLVTYKTTRFYESDVVFADSTFFQVFGGYTFAAGSASAALSRPGSVVLTEEAARRYFGSGNPVGRRITFNEKVEAEVTGVLRSSGHPTHLNADFIASFDILKTEYGDLLTLWGWDLAYTYMVLDPAASPSGVVAQLPELMNRHLPQFKEGRGYEYRYSLQPLTDIHLHSDRQWELTANGRAGYVWTLVMVAGLILLISCGNVIHLQMAQLPGRMQEVGVRRILGAGKAQIYIQFVVEAFVILSSSLLLALIIVETALPTLQRFTGGVFSRRLFDRLDERLFVAAALLILLLMSFFPVHYLVQRRLTGLLKKQFGERPGRLRLQQGLVVGQFAISVALLIALMVLRQQLTAWQTRQLGFRQESVLIVKGYNLTNQFDVLRQTFSALNGVERVTATSGLPGSNIEKMRVTWEGQEEPRPVDMLWVDEHFLPTLGIRLLAGRNFSPQFGSDSTAFLVNETAVRQFGWKRPLGKHLRWGRRQGPIVGVMKDFHHASLKQTIEPLVLCMRPEGYSSLAVRTGKDTKAVIARLERAWKGVVPHQPFEYDFLDQQVSRQYRKETIFGQIFSWFTGLSMLIACMGLFALTALVTQQRTKEIGVRKVLGASVISIVGLVSRDFLKLVFIATLIASPLAWWAMNEWLADFAYRIDIEWWMFAGAGGTAILIALLTVSFQSIKAALMNPVKSLRTE